MSMLLLISMWKSKDWKVITNIMLSNMVCRLVVYPLGIIELFSFSGIAIPPIKVASDCG